MASRGQPAKYTWNWYSNIANDDVHSCTATCLIANSLAAIIPRNFNIGNERRLWARHQTTFFHFYTPLFMYVTGDKSLLATDQSSCDKEPKRSTRWCEWHFDLFIKRFKNRFLDQIKKYPHRVGSVSFYPRVLRYSQCQVYTGVLLKLLRDRSVGHLIAFEMRYVAGVQSAL